MAGKNTVGQQKATQWEALDCFVYAGGAAHPSISRWQLDLSALLASLQEEDGCSNQQENTGRLRRALSGEDE